MGSGCRFTVLKEYEMDAVDIDVSKGKSMIAVMRPFEEVVHAPF